MYDLDTEDGMRKSVEWTTKLFDTMSDGGRWGIPRSGVTVTIDKKNKTATITPGYRPDPSIERVILAMGWKVEY